MPIRAPIYPTSNRIEMYPSALPVWAPELPIAEKINKKITVITTVTIVFASLLI